MVSSPFAKRERQCCYIRPAVSLTWVWVCLCCRNLSANVNTLHIALGAASTGVCRACACASDQGCVIPGKFYTLATGANERRWGKMKPRLEQVVESFEVSTRYDAVG